MAAEKTQSAGERTEKIKTIFTSAVKSAGLNLGNPFVSSFIITNLKLFFNLATIDFCEKGPIYIKKI